MKVIYIKNTTHQEIVRQTIEVLQAGGLVVFPTETTYGAGVDATNSGAVEKLLKYKSRREGKPLSIAVDGLKMAEEYVELSEDARKMYDRFLPGPFTVVSKSKGKVAVGVESEFGTLGVRWADYDLVVDIVRELGRPMTATSANASGKRRPYTVDHILDNLSQKQKSLIDLVIDAGELPHNKPSTVIDTTLSTPVTLREGDKLAKEDASKNSTQLKLISDNEQETRDIAKRFVLKNWNEVQAQGLLIGLDGELGVGKTIFTKGVADFLKIEEPITSPTYSYINEYDFVRHQTSGKFFHLDVWKVESAEDLERLEFFELLKPGRVIVVEWWDQVEKVLGELSSDKKAALEKIKFLKVVISEVDEGKRKLMIEERK